MNIAKITVAVAAALIISACSEKESEDGIIPEGYKSAVEKAKGVEGKLEDTMQMHREEIDESER